MPVWSTLLTQSLCGTKVSDLLPGALGIGGDHPHTAAYQCSAGSQGLPYVPSWRIAVVDLVGLPDVSAFRLSFSPLVGLLELL